MPNPPGPAAPPRVPDHEDRRHEAAHDRLAELAGALFRSGVLVLNGSGTLVLNTTIQEILDGRLDDIETDIANVSASETLTITERVGRCENALRFLGVEVAEFPEKNEFPLE